MLHPSSVPYAEHREVRSTFDEVRLEQDTKHVLARLRSGQSLEMVFDDREQVLFKRMWRKEAPSDAARLGTMVRDIMRLRQGSVLPRTSIDRIVEWEIAQLLDREDEARSWLQPVTEVSSWYQRPDILRDHCSVLRRKIADTAMACLMLVQSVMPEGGMSRRIEATEIANATPAIIETVETTVSFSSTHRAALQIPADAVMDSPKAPQEVVPAPKTKPHKPMLKTPKHLTPLVKWADFCKNQNNSVTWSCEAEKLAMSGYSVTAPRGDLTYNYWYMGAEGARGDLATPPRDLMTGRAVAGADSPHNYTEIEDPNEKIDPITGRTPDGRTLGQVEQEKADKYAEMQARADALRAKTEGKLADHDRAFGSSIADVLPFNAGALSGIHYTKEHGIVVDVGVQFTPDGDQSLVFLGRVGEKERGILAAYGYAIGKNKQLFIMWEDLRQKRTSAVSKTDYWVDQQKFAMRFRWAPEDGPVKILEVDTSGSYSHNKKIKTWTTTEITSATTDTYRHTEQFVGATRGLLGAAGTVDVGESGELKLGLKITSDQYHDGSGNGIQPGGMIRYTHYLGGENGKLYTEADLTAGRMRVSGWYEWPLPGTTATVGPEAFYAAGGNMPNDHGVMVKFGFPLGGNPRTTNYDRPRQGDVGDIGANTAAFAMESRSDQVLGKETYTKERIDSQANAPGAMGAVSVTNDSGSSNSDGIMNVQAALSYPAATNAARYEVSTNGTTWTDVGNITNPIFGTTAGLAALADGTYTVRVRAVNAAGVAGTESTKSITIDTVAPDKTAESFPTFDTQAAGFSGTMTLDENVDSVVSVTVSNGGTASVTGGLSTNTLTITGTAGTDPGQITVVLKDKAGNQRTVTSNSYPLM